MSNKNVNREALIQAILKRDKEKLTILISDREPQIHQFYTQDGNVWMGAGDQIEHNEQGDYFDAKGNKITYQQLKEFETKSRKRTEKLQMIPDLICLQLCNTERLNEIIFEIKENAKATN